MKQREDLDPGGSETGQTLRMFRDDLADEVKFVGLFLAVMVPAGVVGYVVNGSTGAFYGAIAGAAIVVIWMALSATRTVTGWLRRRSG